MEKGNCILIYVFEKVMFVQFSTLYSHICITPYSYTFMHMYALTCMHIHALTCMHMYALTCILWHQFVMEYLHFNQNCVLFSLVMFTQQKYNIIMHNTQTLPTSQPLPIPTYTHTPCTQLPLRPQPILAAMPHAPPPSPHQ